MNKDTDKDTIIYLEDKIKAIEEIEQTNKDISLEVFAGNFEKLIQLLTMFC